MDIPLQHHFFHNSLCCIENVEFCVFGILLHQKSGTTVSLRLTSPISPQNSLKPEAQVSTQAPPAIIPPPPDIQPVIDKLAEYVARNGLKFEASVRAKNDPR